MSDRPTELPPIPEAPAPPEEADAPEPTPPEELATPEAAEAAELPETTEPAEPKEPNDSVESVKPKEADETEEPDESVEPDEPTALDEEPDLSESPEGADAHAELVEPDETDETDESVQSIESVEPEGPHESVEPDEPADPDEAPDPGEAEDANEPDAPSEEDGEDGEAGDPETGDQSENPLAAVAEALGERHPEVASVITKLGADDANRLNVIEDLKDPEGGGERTLEIVQELAEGETLEGRSLEEYRSENPGRGPLFEPVEHEVNYEPDGTSRKNAYVEQTKVDDPVRALGASIEDSDREALDDYGMRLQNEVEPAVYEDVTSLLEEAGGADDAELSIRTKSADGLVDKVNRMTEGSEGRKARPDYEIGDVIDAVGARITVEDTAQLETVLEEAKEYFGTGEDGRLLEVENMYAEPKSGNPSYRVIPMVVAIEVDGKPYTYELQLTTKRASVAADLEHNTVYKSHIEATPEERDVMRKMQAEAAALDQEETRRRYP